MQWPECVWLGLKAAHLRREGSLGGNVVVQQPVGSDGNSAPHVAEGHGVQVGGQQCQAVCRPHQCGASLGDTTPSSLRRRTRSTQDLSNQIILTIALFKSSRNEHFLCCTISVRNIDGNDITYQPGSAHTQQAEFVFQPIPAIAVNSLVCNASSRHPP